MTVGFIGYLGDGYFTCCSLINMGFWLMGIVIMERDRCFVSKANILIMLFTKWYFSTLIMAQNRQLVTLIIKPNSDITWNSLIEI